jgi:hypothetical protein
VLFPIFVISAFSITFDFGWVRHVDTKAFARSLTSTIGMMALAIACVMRRVSGKTAPGRSTNTSNEAEFAAAMSNKPFSTAPFRCLALLGSYLPAAHQHTLSFRLSAYSHTRAFSFCSAPYPLQKTKENLRPTSARRGAKFVAKVCAAASV